MNILTTENLAKYNTKNRIVGIGEWHQRNGVWAMDIRPEPFYQNYTDTDGTTKLSYILKDEFTSGQYVFSLWIDSDDVNNGSGSYSQAGFTLYYSDETSVSLRVTGAENKGFQHKFFISDASKKCDRLNVYYARNLPTYYRYDSFIVPVEQTSFNKNGIIDSGFYIEGLESINTISSDTNLGMSIGKFGIDVEDFIEY